MKENTKIVFNYIKEHEADNITASDIAEKTGLPVKSVNGIITSALIGTGKAKESKGYVQRVAGYVTSVNDEGVELTKEAKFIKLTERGQAATVESIEADEMAALQAKLAAKNA
jgi:DNA-binding MarR family transcriptional regulator